MLELHYMYMCRRMFVAPTTLYTGTHVHNHDGMALMSYLHDPWTA